MPTIAKGCVRAKPGAQEPIKLSHVGGRGDPHLWVTSCYFPGCTSTGSGTETPAQDSDRGCDILSSILPFHQIPSPPHLSSLSSPHLCLETSLYNSNPWHFFFFRIYFYVFEGRSEYRDFALVHFSSSHSVWTWARLRSETRQSIHVSHLSGRSPPWPPSSSCWKHAQNVVLGKTIYLKQGLNSS